MSSQLLKFEEGDLLRDAVFGQCEVASGKSFDRVAIFVFDVDGFDDQLCGALKRGLPAWLRVLADLPIQAGSDE